MWYTDGAFIYFHALATHPSGDTGQAALKALTKCALTGMVVGKIMLGLGQVVSRQPEATKTDFPGPQWDAEFLKLFFMDFE